MIRAIRVAMWFGVVVVSLPACGSDGEEDLFGGSGGTGGAVGGSSSGAGGATAGTSTNGGGGAGGDPVPSGGSVNMGGAAPSGGSGGSLTAGAAGVGGIVHVPTPGDGGVCASGSKACGGLCLPFDPFVGCGQATCTPCPVPPGGVGVCSGEACDFECVSGYVREGDACVTLDGGLPPDGGVGAGGASGNPSECPDVAPTATEFCIALPYTCTYGATQCRCIALALIPFWFCQ